MLECPSMSWTTFGSAPAAKLVEAGGTVAEVVQADRRQAAGVVELAEVARQPVRRHGVAVGPGEHVAAVEVVFAGGGGVEVDVTPSPARGLPPPPAAQR